MRVHLKQSLVRGDQKTFEGRNLMLFSSSSVDVFSSKQCLHRLHVHLFYLRSTIQLTAGKNQPHHGIHIPI